jgi:hypothetical protein
VIDEQTEEQCESPIDLVVQNNAHNVGIKNDTVTRLGKGWDTPQSVFETWYTKAIL